MFCPKFSREIFGNACSEVLVVWHPVVKQLNNTSIKVALIGRRAIGRFEIMGQSIERSRLLGTWFVHCTDANW